MTVDDPSHTQRPVPAVAWQSRSTTPTADTQKARLARKQQRRLDAAKRSNSISPALDEIVPDPGGVLETLGVFQPKAFWQWYHAPDGPEDPAASRMGQKWGEIWSDYLLSDPLVLAGAVPLVLQKKAQMTGVQDERKFQLAEFRALQNLRHRLADLEPASYGGLVVMICGRVYINVQHGEFDVALMHVQAMRRLLDIHRPTGSEWLCSAWTDLRVVSSTASAPILERFVPDEWKDCIPISPTVAQGCQRSAMQNMRAVGHAGSQRFLLTYAIFRQLHDLEAMSPFTEPTHPPIEAIYNAVYDSCVLDAELCTLAWQDSSGLQAQLLAICLKICAWERASHFVPRGGEIERKLLSRADQLLSANEEALHIPGKRSDGGPTAHAMVWMLFTLTATAYMFERDSIDIWIQRLKSVSPAFTSSAFQRSLKGWPTAQWWLGHPLRRICSALAPSKGQWRIMMDEPDPVPVFSSGLRLKLLVIEG